MPWERARSARKWIPGYACACGNAATWTSILGQGAFKAGWHAHQLSQPGAFLISDPEHAVPERHRAYLIDDEQIARHAARHARPALSAATADITQTAPESPHTVGDGPADDNNGHDGPEAALWGALLRAGDGAPITELMAACGMGRSWVYYRLREHARAARAMQTTRGAWRAVRPGDGRPPGHPGTSRPPRSPRRPRGDVQ